MKKIAIIGTIASSIYNFRADLIRQLISRECTVYAFVCEASSEDFLKITAMGVTPIRYGLSRGGLNPFDDIWSTYALSKKLRELRPDVVFSYFSKPVIFGTLAAKLAGVPRAIGMLEGLGYTFTAQPSGLARKTKFIRKIQTFLYRLSLPLLDKLIFLNPDDPKDLLEANRIKVKEVHILGGIGLDLERYRHSPLLGDITQPIKFLFIGRLLKEKGIHEFIASAKAVKNDYPDVVFTVIGAIDKENLGALSEGELKELIESGVIDYPGYVNNIHERIARCHVFVLPSYREGVPRSTQEAMAVGRAVITTDVPGCRETVVDGVNGFVVPKWNPEALAEKMIFFIKNPEEISKMGNESHRMAIEKFDAEKVNQKLIKILGI